MITQYDLKLMLQQPIQFAVKIEVLKENGTILDTLKGVTVSGSSTIDSASSIRRTFSATIIPTLFDRNDTKIMEDGLIWLGKELHLYVGVMDARTKEYRYYSQGYYVYTNTSASYDASTNQLTINCSDFMSKLDGTKNGQMGALTTTIPAYEENPETGDIIKYNIIRESVIKVLTELGNIKNYYVDDIGEYKALQKYNDKWEQYRKDNPLWNVIPYDLDFSCGCSVLSILEKLRDLYPNYEMYFDEYNTFVCKMIVSSYQDDIVFNNDFIQRILISESTSIEMNKVRNICEVWGKVIETDFYAEESTYANNIYGCTITGYDKYYNGDLVGIKIAVKNSAGCFLNINNLGVIQIMDENTDSAIGNHAISENSVYVFKIKSRRENGSTTFYAYLLGQWQAHGMNVLTDGSIGEVYTFPDNFKANINSIEYFRKKYNCESVELEIIHNSPFTVQKLGEILDVKTGGEFENITSDSLALSRAKWENWKNCRLTDSISITTNLVPFLDVNIKVSYQRSDLNHESPYIIKSVSHDYSSWTSSITMCRFYPLYDELIKEMGTHKALSEYKHGGLSKYTHDELNKLIGGGLY